MGKFSVGNGQYVVYAKDSQEARMVISQELQRVDKIKEKMANLLSKDGTAIQNFLENTSEENLNIHFNDETSLIFDDPENATTKGEVITRSSENDKFTYNLAYRYPDIQGHNADFRLAHEMGHLMLNPSNGKLQTYDKETDTRQVTGLIRVTRGQEKNEKAFYGKQMQENAKNLIAQFLQRNDILMNIPFVEKFVDKQLNVLPPALETRTQSTNSAREDFLNLLSNNGEYRNLPPIQRMSEPERMAQMQWKMQQKQQSTDEVADFFLKGIAKYKNLC